MRWRLLCEERQSRPSHSRCRHSIAHGMPRGQPSSTLKKRLHPEADSLRPLWRALQILTALTSRLELDAAVSLQQVANACEGFSGADLSALLSDAQLEAVHEVLAGARAADEVSCWMCLSERGLACAAVQSMPEACTHEACHANARGLTRRFSP